MYQSTTKPTALGQTNEAWYVHIEGVAIDENFTYTNRRPTELMLMGLVVEATPFNPNILEFSGLGYEDITIIVQEEWLARALVNVLAGILPSPTPAWVGLCDIPHVVYARKHAEESDEGGGEFYWLVVEPTEDDPIFPV